MTYRPVHRRSETRRIARSRHTDRWPGRAIASRGGRCRHDPRRASWQAEPELDRVSRPVGEQEPIDGRRTHLRDGGIRRRTVLRWRGASGVRATGLRHLGREVAQSSDCRLVWRGVWHAAVVRQLGSTNGALNQCGEGLQIGEPSRHHVGATKVTVRRRGGKGWLPWARSANCRPVTAVVRDLDEADRILGSRRVTQSAIESGFLTTSDGAAWLSHLRTQSFFAAVTFLPHDRDSQRRRASG